MQTVPGVPAPVPARRSRRPRPRLGRLIVEEPVELHHYKLGRLRIPAGTALLLRIGRYTLEVLEPAELRGLRFARGLRWGPVAAEELAAALVSAGEG